MDRAPALALLGVWALAGLAGALEIARSGDLRHLALGVVTLPALVAIAVAMRRARRLRPARGS